MSPRNGEADKKICLAVHTLSLMFPKIAGDEWAATVAEYDKKKAAYEARPVRLLRPIFPQNTFATLAGSRYTKTPLRPNVVVDDPPIDVETGLMAPCHSRDVYFWRLKHGNLRSAETVRWCCCSHEDGYIEAFRNGDYAEYSVDRLLCFWPDSIPDRIPKMSPPSRGGYYFRR